MRKLLTQKQENFCLFYVYGENGEPVTAGRAMELAKYAPGFCATHSTKLLNSAKVQVRIAELRKRLEDAKVMAPLERRQRLTEIGRANIPDFRDEGGGIEVKKKSPNVGAVAEITTKTKMFRKSMEPVVITNLKLHSPTQAIDLLNKMDHIYTDAPQLNVVNVKALVFMMPDGTQLTPKEIASGNRDTGENPPSARSG